MEASGWLLEAKTSEAGRQWGRGARSRLRGGKPLEGPLAAHWLASMGWLPSRGSLEAACVMSVGYPVPLYGRIGSL